MSNPDISLFVKIFTNHNLLMSISEKVKGRQRFGSVVQARLDDETVVNGMVN